MREKGTQGKPEQPRTGLSHLYETADLLTDTESGSVIAGGWGERDGTNSECVRSFHWGDENVLELGNGG